MMSGEVPSAPAARGLFADPASMYPLNFKYEEYAQAKTLHKNIARWKMAGMSDEKISMVANCSVREVRKVCEHRPMALWIDAQKEAALADAQEMYGEMTEGRQLGIRALRDRLHEPEKMKVENIIRAATFFADRHPDGKLVKQARTEVNVNKRVYGSEALSDLRKRAARIGITSAQDIVVHAKSAASPAESDTIEENLVDPDPLEALTDE